MYTVLIQGESGVGKEIFADIIHDNGPRHKMPFIKFNCAAFPDQLIDAELFGYATGAFTGASKHGKAGLFEAAIGGSIFLDEIGEMPLHLQAKLLRVLQKREIYRIGDSTPIKVDVRIIAATNLNLKDMVKEKRFREDLFFRLNVINIVVPPLRDRPESILPFTYHFLEKYNSMYRFSKQIDQKVINLFLEYDWPGNVRELENRIEQLVVITPGEIINKESLPEKWQGGTTDRPLPAIGERSLTEIMTGIERSLLEQAMHLHKTTRKAAKVLKVNQSTVVRKLKRYGIISTIHRNRKSAQKIGHSFTVNNPMDSAFTTSTSGWRLFHQVFFIVVLRLHRVRGGRPSRAVRHLLCQHPAGQCTQTEHHLFSL